MSGDSSCAGAELLRPGAVPDPANLPASRVDEPKNTATFDPPGERTLRIAVLVDQFPELSETFIAEEVCSLQAQGHRVHVEAASHAGTPNLQAVRGVTVAYGVDDPLWRNLLDMCWLVARHPLRSARDLVARRSWRREEEVRPFRLLASIARRVERRGDEHLHVHFAAGAALDGVRLGLLLDRPYSVATHGYDIFQRPRNLREKHARAAFAVTACDYSLEHLRRSIGAPHDARIHKLVMGVDGDVFRRRRPHPGGRSVLAVGRLLEKKGFSYLIEAVRKLRSTGVVDRLLLVGEGPLRAELEGLVRELGVSDVVHLLGMRRPEEVRALLEEVDVLAMPCVVAADGDRDTMPVVVKEALAMEVPVVATDEVGLPEVVRCDWGSLVPPRDADALAEALAEMLGLTPARRAEMGAAGRRWVLEHCNLHRETAKLANLIGDASSRRSQTTPSGGSGRRCRPSRATWPH